MSLWCYRQQPQLSSEDKSICSSCGLLWGPGHRARLMLRKDKTGVKNPQGSMVSSLPAYGESMAYISWLQCFFSFSNYWKAMSSQREVTSSSPCPPGKRAAFHSFLSNLEKNTVRDRVEKWHQQIFSSGGFAPDSFYKIWAKQGTFLCHVFHLPTFLDQARQTHRVSLRLLLRCFLLFCCRAASLPLQSLGKPRLLLPPTTEPWCLSTVHPSTSLLGLGVTADHLWLSWTRRFMQRHKEAFQAGVGKMDSRDRQGLKKLTLLRTAGVGWVLHTLVVNPIEPRVTQKQHSRGARAQEKCNEMKKTDQQTKLQSCPSCLRFHGWK